MGLLQYFVLLMAAGEPAAVRALLHHRDIRTGGATSRSRDMGESPHGARWAGRAWGGPAGFSWFMFVAANGFWAASESKFRLLRGHKPPRRRGKGPCRETGGDRADCMIALALLSAAKLYRWPLGRPWRLTGRHHTHDGFSTPRSTCFDAVFSRSLRLAVHRRGAGGDAQAASRICSLIALSGTAQPRRGSQARAASLLLRRAREPTCRSRWSRPFDRFSALNDRHGHRWRPGYRRSRGG